MNICTARENLGKIFVYYSKFTFGGSKSFNVIDVGTPGKAVSSACYDSSKSVSICNRFHARLVDSSRNRAFWRGTQLWCPRK